MFLGVFAVPPSNTDQYEEEFLESARVVASRKQDHWDNFSFSRVRAAADRIRQRKSFYFSFLRLGTLGGS